MAIAVFSLETPLSKGIELHARKLTKRPERVGRQVQAALRLSTKKEAENIVNTVISCIEHTLLNNLETNYF